MVQGAWLALASPRRVAAWLRSIGLNCPSAGVREAPVATFWERSAEGSWDSSRTIGRLAVEGTPTVDPGARDRGRRPCSVRRHRRRSAMIVVRRIRLGEADALRLVRLAALAESPSSFGSTYAGESSLTIEDWTDRTCAGSNGSERATFFAVANEDIVGLVGGYRPEPSSETVELVSMWTHPAVRRAGVGRLLVNAVLDWARACGAREVQLWVTRGNPAAEVHRDRRLSTTAI